jgi:hypothetical protein
VKTRRIGIPGISSAGVNKSQIPSPFHLPCRDKQVEGAAMTRPAIERCIWVFIVALILTFGWTLTKVAGLLGVF